MIRRHRRDVEVVGRPLRGCRPERSRSYLRRRGVDPVVVGGTGTRLRSLRSHLLCGVAGPPQRGSNVRAVRTSEQYLLSALALAWLGFASSDDEVVSIAQRWIDRPAPLIQSGAAALVAIMTCPEKPRPIDLAVVRSWFETPCRGAATSTSAFATPLTAAYLAEGDIPSAHTVAADFRNACSTMDGTPVRCSIQPFHRLTG